MASCLGIYIDKNLIKYAKVNRNKDILKIEAFNVETFEDLEETLSKIIIETNSSKIPISINISKEMYNYFDVFAILEKKDITKSLDIEFEMLCNKKGYHKKRIESRYLLMDNKEDYEKYKALYISASKKEIEQRIELLSKYRLSSITPISTSITNLVGVEANENVAIINIESKTQITAIVDGQITRVDTLDAGIGNILERINSLELSWKKAYDVFKNIIIYNHEVTSLDKNENEYLDVVMPVINQIAKETKILLNSFQDKISKLYITGIGATISNIDLYFQDYLKNIKCEILKPFFINSNSLKVPTKEYIEVNSAIALALDGLGFLNKDLNFVSTTKIESLENIMVSRENFENDKRETDEFTIQEKMLFRIIVVFLITIIGFTSLGGIIASDNNKRIQAVKEKLTETTNQINNIENQIYQIESYTNIYSNIINNNQDLQNNRIINKDAIPNLLNKIMFIIPQKVQITSIKNTEKKHIKIEAISEVSEQLTYFVQAIQNDQILTNIQSTTNEKNDSLVQIIIEGDLP